MLYFGWISTGMAAAIVLHRAGAVVMDADCDLRAVAGQCLVDRVINDFEDTVVETALIGIADIHIGALAHTFKAFELLDFRGVVNVFGGGSSRGFGRKIFGRGIV
jgi:hypothetical protein